MREKDRYDYFLVQEDDVLYDLSAINYFVDYYQNLKGLSPALYPNFFDYEDLHGNKYANYRMRAGHIFKLNADMYFSSTLGSCGRGYMIPVNTCLKCAAIVPRLTRRVLLENSIQQSLPL